MVAVNGGIIRYHNKALMALMQRLESAFRKVFPDFTAAGLLGAHLDRFHKSPNHHQNILANLKGEHRAQIHVAGVPLRLTVNPIIDENGVQLGTVVECLDPASEANAGKEIGAMAERAAAGDGSKAPLVHATFDAIKSGL